jgi:omega-6 fatty acid desaturase (delta-12 desaturase)
MTQDQVFVPKTRSELGLPKFNPDGEELLGSRVTEEVVREFKEAISDSPIVVTIGFFAYLVRNVSSFPGQLYLKRRLSALQIAGWPMYLIKNSSGQKRYAKGTNRKAWFHLCDGDSGF